MKHVTVLLLGLFAVNAWASQDLTSDMDALGANQDLIKKARAVDPQNRVRVVQNRDVDRNYRFEIGANASLYEGGDPYTNTNSLGANLDFHINPHWSVGARWASYANNLSSEGKKVFDNFASCASNPVCADRAPGVDYASNSYLGVINWYPIYGKVNLFDTWIAQFDIYFLAGAGTIALSSGSAPLYTGGAGIGFWWTQHFDTRVEARWQGYQDQPTDGRRQIDQLVMGLTFGFLL